MTSKGIRVLIVDDEERFRTTTASILTRRGFEVTAVGSGPEAIEVIGETEADVVVLDRKMPGMDGHEVLREIKKIAPHVEVIMLTGHGSLESAREGMEDGVYDYLTKPCHIDLIARKIQEAASRERGPRETEPTVADLMIPVSDYASIQEDRPVSEAVELILQCHGQALATSTIHGFVHRSILVRNAGDAVVGVLGFPDLLSGLQPSYLQLIKDSTAMARSVYSYSPSFPGMFTILVRDLALKKVTDVMSPNPPTIEVEASITEAAGRFLLDDARRLLVLEDGVVVGVIREQDVILELGITMRRERLVELNNRDDPGVVG